MDGIKIWCRLALLFLAALLLNGPVAAQHVETLRGVVLDHQTKAPLPGATVTIRGTSRFYTTSSDFNGWFEIENVPVGLHDIVVELKDYKNLLLRNVEVVTGKEAFRVIELDQKVQDNKKDIDIRPYKPGIARNATATVSAFSFNRENVQASDNVKEDPAEMAARLPAFQQILAGRNDLSIRGNSPTGLVWQLDDIPVVAPNFGHEIGLPGGTYPLQPNALLGKSEIDYGPSPAGPIDALAGKFNLRFRDGNRVDRRYSLEMGSYGAAVSAEGPISRKPSSSYLVYYRNSLPSVLEGSGVEAVPGIFPDRQQAAFKVNIPTRFAGTFSVFATGGKNKVEMLPGSSAHPENFYVYGGLPNTDNYLDETLYTGGFSHKIYLKRGISSIKTTVGISGYEKTSRMEMHRSANLRQIDTGNDNKEQELFFSSRFQHKPSVSNYIVAGISARIHQVNFADSTLTGNVTQVYPKTYYTLLDANEKGMVQVQADAGWQHKFGNTTAVYVGLNASYFTFNQTASIEPRLSIRHEYNSKTIVSIGYGLKSQLQPMFLYFMKTKADPTGTVVTEGNRNLSPTRMHELVGAVDRNFRGNLRLHAEIYFQQLMKVPVEQHVSSYSMMNYGAGFRDYSIYPLVNQGTGQNKGLELQLDKYLSHGYYFRLSGAVYDSKYKASDGASRNTAFNGAYKSDLTLGTRFPFSQSGLLDLNLHATYSGGTPLPGIDDSTSVQAGYTVYDEASRYVNRAPAWFRVDAQVSLKWSMRWLSHELSFNLHNLTGEKILLRRFYNPELGAIDEQYQLGFVPTILYRVYF
ncbi:TonB-dependent receptor [Prolixibacter sp. NT017]|uniref:TonB-dependent receptor n=1 Tax=Prolixibacter sp. NT017 TaxID=2652390 RepID=UPI0012881883|nr:TonB-dependent receptor [Prolixibacter sp. NT017]GET26791.1 prevent-host-death protein [Prolixibacter sp. NT017]